MPQTLNSPFYVTYGANNRVGGDTDLTTTSKADATSAAGAGASAGGNSSSDSLAGVTGSSNNTMLWIVGASILLSVISIGLIFFHRK